MDILLLNDTTFAPWLPAGTRVLSAGPEALYVMPDQDRFDIHLGPQLEHDLETVLEQCRARIPDFMPDVIIQFETSQNYFYRGIERSPALTVWRVIDTHMFHAWQPLYAQLFDLTLVAQKDYLPQFAPYADARWLPLNTNLKVHHDRGLERDIPVSFVGSMNPVVHPERVRFFEALRKLAPVQVFSGKNQLEISEIYNRSSIVLNECLHRDLNYRLFETLSNGALCLTPRIDAGQSELFTDEVHLVEYDDRSVEDAAAKIHALLADPERLERIRRQGYSRVVEAHDIRHRVETALGWIDARLQARTPRAADPGMSPTSAAPSGSTSPSRAVNAETLLPVVSLLAEFTFELRRTGGLHLQDLVRQAGERDPLRTAYYLTSLCARWLQRGNRDAAAFLLSEARRLEVTDARLEQALETLRRSLTAAT